MPDITKTIEERVTDLETIYTDMPEILNLRFEALEGQLSDIRARLGLIDRNGAMITRDMRDVRSGVSGQMRLQNEKLERMEAKLEHMDGRLERVEGRLERVEGEVAKLKGEVVELKGELARTTSGLSRQLDQIQMTLAEVVSNTKR